MVLMFYLTSDSSEKHIKFGKTFRHFCWNCILNVPRTFWGVFIENMFVFQFDLDFEAKLFEIWRNFPTESSKVQFTSPEEHFDEKIVGFLKQTSTLGEKISYFRRKICRTYQMSTICFQMANWKNIFLRTSREHFLVFSLNHFRQGGQNCISHAKRNIPIRKIFRRNFFYRFWNMREIFLNFHWNILDMVVKITVYVFRGALWEKFPTRREFFLDFQRIFFGMVVKLTVYVLRGALWDRLSFSNFSKLLSELDR